MDVDHLVIGNGICGALLSRGLLQAGSSVMVIDAASPSAASRVAGGIINPVTGKRLVRSWMIETLLPFALDTYRKLEEGLNTPLVKECSILEFYANLEQKAIFEEKAVTEHEYLRTVDSDDGQEQYFRFNYGIGEIAPSLLIDVRALVNGWRNLLQERGGLRDEQFSWADCEVAQDHVIYKDIRAKNIICCEGAPGAVNPYFDLLPWSADKGEALIVSIRGLPRDHIYKQGISIVPWGDDLFWVGAPHDWKYTDMQPTALFRQRVEEQLGYWLKLPYTVTDHIVAQRPANMERKPFVGMHPLFPSVGIFNGMGGKGISMAPYFAHEFAKHLTNGKPLTPDVSVSRFARILSSKQY